ncbi:MAG TPA: Rrf2 family transcriptional regulator [Polyangia bacterium]
MRLSRKSEYACLALLELAAHHGRRLVKTTDIARRQGIPREYLAQILNALKAAGYVAAVRGARGGYRLARAPAAISVAEIVRLMDGPLAPVASVSKYFYARTPIARSRKLRLLLKDVRDYTARLMEGTSFADLV